MNRLVGLTLLCASLATPAALSAQEQENPSTPGQIPDPSTYQGSTVLQQQSDQQDQSFRQQQQQQSNQYNSYGTPQYQSGNSGNYPPAGPNGYRGGSNATPASRCNLAMMQAPAFARLRGLVELGASTEDPRYFMIDRKATALEKPVLLKWRAARLRCLTMATGYRADIQAMNLRSGDITNRMILAVADGRMTYADFNYTRAHNHAVLMNYMRTH